MPSSRRQISTMDWALSASRANPGRTSLGPVQKEPDRGEAAKTARVVGVLGLGELEGRHPEGDLARHVQRLPARRQHRDVRTVAVHRGDERGTRGEQMLAVVEHQQQVARSQPGHQRAQRIGAGRRLQPERGRDRVRQGAGIRDRNQVGHPGPVGVRADEPAGHLLGQSRLAGAAHPGEGQQVGLGQQALDVGRSPAPARRNWSAFPARCGGAVRPAAPVRPRCPRSAARGTGVGSPGRDRYRTRPAGRRAAARTGPGPPTAGPSPRAGASGPGPRARAAGRPPTPGAPRPAPPPGGRPPPPVPPDR